MGGRPIFYLEHVVIFLMHLFMIVLNIRQITLLLLQRQEVGLRKIKMASVMS